YLPKPFNPTLLQARVEASLAKKRLHDRERLHAQSLERELEIGRQIQQGFLPTELPRPAGWEIAASFQPARQVAGDFYDAFPLGADRLGLIVADVCGKGVGAALFMALFRSLLRAHAHRASAELRGRPSIEAVLLDAVWSTNGYITTVHRPAHIFASVFFGVLETPSGRLHYINAGHNPPVILDASGPRSQLDTTGPALGVLSDATFGVAEATVRPGETLLAYTDGIIEARNAARVFFSEERFYALLEAPPARAADLLARLEDAVRAHVVGTVPTDDVTMLAVRRG
ncbi:MAG: PP2C family protein-serine/threonine phosphatase, partial [Rhodothermales bacterium]|nr:PP2C family protein-serine/threonine phosphatase [Rhodothermales bacterium]